MALAQDVYLLSDLTVTLASGAVANKSELRIETNPTFIARKVAKKSSQVYTGEDAPTLSFTYINTGDLHFESVKSGEAVGTFTVTSDNDAATSMIADLITDWPVSGWVWGKKSTGYTNDGDSTTTVEIQAGVLNPLT